MKLLPHKTIPTSQVPLLRKLEAYEDPYDLESKAAKLVGLLWEKMPKSDPIETCFRQERLLMYHAKGAERSFSVPFLHHFYLPTKEGLSWMQNRFEKKYGMHVELIKSSSHFEAYQKAFL